MTNFRILSTVSALALTAGVMTSAQAATTPNLLIDLDSPTISTSGAAAGAIIASDGTTAATIVVSDVQGPDVSAGLIDIGGGANTSEVVDGNTIFALTIANDTDNEADLSAATGVSPANGLIVGTVNTNVGGAFTADVTSALILNDIEDPGVNNTLSTSTNTISSTLQGNDLRSFIGRDIAGGGLVDGDIPDGYTSAEQGQITIDDTGFGNGTLPAGREMEASASYTVGSAQLNTGLTESTADVVDPRIALVAITNDDVTVIEDNDLDVVGNVIEAAIDGNNAVNAIDLTAGDPTGFSGSASVANLQANAFNDTTFEANIDGAVIEAGDDDNDIPIGDLLNSSLDVNNNQILANAAANRSDNEINVAAGISIDGPNAAALAQGNTLSLTGPNEMNLQGDLIIGNAQASDTAVDADIEGEIDISTESVTTSTINLNDSVLFADAVMNDADNAITVAGATTFDGVVGVSNLQFANADVDSDTDVDIDAEIANEDAAAIESVLGSAISISRNAFTSSATGNNASSTASITGTNIVVDAVDGSGGLVDRDLSEGEAQADFTVFSAQLLDDGDVDADMDSEIDIDVSELGGIVDSTTEASSVTVSENTFAVQAIGNRVQSNGLSIDAEANFSGTAAVVSSQTVQGDSTIEATQDDEDDIILVEIDSDDVIGSSIMADSNVITATAIGNLVDPATNSLSITGTTISDGGESEPFSGVDRDDAGTGIADSDAEAGFTLITDQAVVDNAGTVFAQLDTDDDSAVGVIVGNAGGEITNVSVSTDSNDIFARGTLNAATSSISIGDDGTTGLDGSTALINVQAVVDDNDDGDSGAVLVYMGDDDSDAAPNIDIGLDAGTDDITGVTVTADSNEIEGAGRGNVAGNLITITAGTQVITDVIDSADLQSVGLDTDGDFTGAIGETTLINDQLLEGLETDEDNGIFVEIDDPDITIDIDTDDSDLVDSSISASGNQTRGLVSGNLASNEIVLNVDNFDLTGADAGAGAVNGPIATLVSNQQAIDPEDEDSAFVVSVLDSDIEITLDGDFNDLEATSLNIDNNQVFGAATANQVSNTLNVDGTSLENIAPATPVAVALDFAGSGEDIALGDTMFSITSRQINEFSTVATLEESEIEIDGDDINDIDGSTLSVTGNQFRVEANGNVSANTGSTNFTDNHASMLVVNFQQQVDVVIAAGVNTDETEYTEIQIEADGSDVNDSALLVDNNAILALATANQTTNSVDAGGGSILSGGLAENPFGPTVVHETAGSPILFLSADIGIVNSQGIFAPFPGGPEVDVLASVDESQIEFNVDDLEDAVSASASNNQIAAEALQHQATNSIGLDASANIGATDDAPAVAILSQQGTLEDDNVLAVVEDANIGSIDDDVGDFVGDISNEGSVSLTVDNNSILALAEAGRATNRIDAVAGANIVGNPDRQTGAGDPTATLAGFTPGATDVLTVDYSILNVQQGTGTVEARVETDADLDNIERTGIGIGIDSGAVNDAISVDNNVIQARALGFIGANVIVMDAGANSSATAQVGNTQLNAGPLLATVDGSVSSDPTFEIGFDAILEDGMANSALSVDNNQVVALAQLNTAQNIIVASAGAGFLESSGASADVVDGTGDLVVTNADFAVLNRQQAISPGGDLPITASISDVRALVAFDSDADLDGDLSASTVSVDGNVFEATAVGNDALNVVALSSDLSARPSVVIANVQTVAERTISATATNVTVGIGGVNSATNSSASVSGNSVGASATGNRSFNSIGGQ